MAPRIRDSGRMHNKLEIAVGVGAAGARLLPRRVWASTQLDT